MTLFTLSRLGQLTSAQLGELSRVRLCHPRARVTVPARQRELPLVRLRLYWPGRSIELWIDPDGRRVRYAGLVQFGMWLLRPRVVREFRNQLDDRIRFGKYFDAILAAVARVHEDPTLRDFWRSGRLLENPAGSHPYQAALPSEWARASRWFLLDSTANPPSIGLLTIEPTPRMVLSFAVVSAASGWNDRPLRSAASSSTPRNAPECVTAPSRRPFGTSV